MDNQTISPEQKPIETTNIPTPQQPSSKSKLPIILFIIILLFFFGFGGIFIGKYFSTNQTKITPSIISTPIPQSTIIPSPTLTLNPSITPTSTSDLTTNWKKYTNTKFNYSVKYPNEWFIYDKGTYWPSEKIYKNVQGIVFISPQQRSDLTPGGFEIANAFLIRGDLDSGASSSASDEYYKRENILLNNIQAIKVTSIKQPGMGNPTTDYYFRKNNNYFQVSFENSDLNGSHYPIFDQILSTFKFTQ